jgi:hypothetical protein
MGSMPSKIQSLYLSSIHIFHCTFHEMFMVY